MSAAGAAVRGTCWTWVDRLSYWQAPIKTEKTDVQVSRMTSVDEFRSFRLAILSRSRDKRPCLVVCAGTGGQASGANDILRILKRRILERDLQDLVSLRITGCQGFCEMDPFILVEPANNLYTRVKMEDVDRILDAAIEGKAVEELLYRDPGSEKPCYFQQDIRFFKHQTRVILGQNRELDPIRIHDYIRAGGYAALEKVLADPRPEWIVEEIKRSGLRGRGGAGFPTGRKWDLARRSNGRTSQKYIVCNADEGDPGAYMDRSLLEGNPHAILEGMIIAGIAVGATAGIVYVRTEYPLAVRHAAIAIRQARELGLLGRHVLGTSIDFDVEIVRGAGAFVCGEETSLIRSIEGRMGEPRQRPPYPIDKGIDGCPTCINNVETLANVPLIIDKGAEAYAAIGVPGNTGTKIFSLVGKIRNTGLVEVPLGMTVGEVVYDIGGGAAGDTLIKAVQTGGPSGGCIPARMFDLPIDYESLARAGAIMGSGGMIVMDEDTCMVDVARYFMNFLKGESCGACFTCRKGTQRMCEILEDICDGRGTPEALSLLEELALTVKDTTMCGLGQTASNPVLSTLRYFRHEYERHIADKRCDAFVCKNLVGAPCQTACPLGTPAWKYVALLEKGDYEGAYRVIRQTNPFPSVCARVCDRKCESRCRLKTSGGEALAVRALKRFVVENAGAAAGEFAAAPAARDAARVAVIGAGPAGLAAAHYMSLAGYRVTVFEAADQPGGMLVSAIPPYRLPRDVVRREIDSLIDGNVSLKCGTALGRDVTIDGLFADGFSAVFLAMGAHQSLRLGIEGEDVQGVYPAMRFLRAWNISGEALAKGRVGVIGGGNSAVDAARAAIRQPETRSVTLFYRRTRREMPAHGEEIQAALEEGVSIETMVSPVAIRGQDGRLTGVAFTKNRPGAVDSSGRRRPVAVPGSEFDVPLDTLIVAVGERAQNELAASMGLQLDAGATLCVDPATLCTSKQGVFAGGDLVTGPNTVVDAIAAGKRAAEIIGRYLRGEPLKKPARAVLPNSYVEPAEADGQDAGLAARVRQSVIPVEARSRNFAEVELTFSAEEARCEARRCLRCDLEFTKPKEPVVTAASGATRAC